MAESVFSGPFGQQIQRVIGCDWGRSIAIAADMMPCGERAVQRVVLHGDELGGAQEFKFCGPHCELVLAETAPRGGGS